MSQDLHSDVIIVGAGICGLMAANKLAEAGARVRVLEKDQQVGGRMATRDLGPGRGDIGTQFFTVHTPAFREWVQRWLDEEIVFMWSQGFSDGSLLLLPSLNNYPHYAVHKGMRALPEHLAKPLKNVHAGSAVRAVTLDEDRWVVQCADEVSYSSTTLLMTAPVPVSLKLLAAGGTELTELDFNTLSGLTYAASLSGIFWLDGVVSLPQPGAVQRHNTNMIWIGNNRQKGISPEATVITVQASAQQSARLWEAPERRILEAMFHTLQPFLSDDLSVRESYLERWRYARPITTHKARCLVAAGGIPVVFAGDAFQGPRVEGAVLSGMAAADALLRML
jgi:renalase